MGEPPGVDTESNKLSPRSEAPSEPDRRPFGGLEFQVSEVVERLEAGVNAQEAGDDEKRSEPRIISAGFYEPEETSMDELLRALEELVAKTDPSSESVEPPLLPTDAATRAAILSHSVAALLRRLERGHAARLGARVAAQAAGWMAHMFRLAEYSAYFHQEPLEGLVRVARLLLHARYPRYLEDGALAFATRLPCIYSCVASPLGVVQHLCRQLGLPLASVRPVPVHPAGRGMDAAALERLCEEDAAAGRLPLLVLAAAGAAPLGGGDELAALADASRRRGLHLHARGHALALPAARPPHESYGAADSLTLTPDAWFGVPGLPALTFYKIPEPVSANDHSKGVNSAGSREGALAALAGLCGGAARLPALPLWAALRAAGARALSQRIADAFRSARQVYQIIQEAELKILSAPPGGDEPPNVDLVEAVSGASACVAFQFAPESVGGEAGEAGVVGAAGAGADYYDKLNSWLGQVLQREADMVSIEVCETEAHGVVLRYCPLEGGALCAAGAEAGGAFAALLAAQVQVLSATVQLRAPFERSVRLRPELRLVHVPGWAGLGGVRYEPAAWTGAAPARLDALNRQLVEALRATDGAFSCGADAEGRACVRFGMVTADTDVAELLELVALAARDVEDSSRALTDMTEVLKKGIEEAEADLERESLARLWQEGLLRRVPVVGRVVAWWAPPAAPPPGRRLQLAHGTLQPTSDIYRYVQKKPEGEPARAHSPARSAPPPPPAPPSAPDRDPSPQH